MPRARALATFVVAGAMILGACGGDEERAGPSEDWTVQVGIDAADTTFGIAATADGAIVVVGATEGPLAGTHQGGRDVYIARFDPDGSEVWSVQLGGEANDSPLGVDVAADGAIYVAGFSEGDFAGPHLGSADVWIARFEPDGTETWRRQFGGPEWDRGFDVSAHANGAYVSGYTASVLDAATDREGFDAFVASFDADGNERWIRQYGTDATDWGQGSAAVGDDGLYLTGYTEGGLGGDHLGDKDAFVARIDDTGEVVWVRQFGTDALDWTQGVGVDSDGGVIVAGSTEGPFAAEAKGGRDLVLVAFAADGTQRWAVQHGSAEQDAVFEVRVAGDEIVATGGSAGDLGNPHGDRDAILVRVDLDGNLIGIDQFGTDAVDDATGLAVAPNGAVVYSGYSSGSLGGSAAGGTDIFLGASTGGGS